MAIHLAAETVLLIDHMVEVDQGGRFRQILEKCIPEVGDAYRPQEEAFRSHLGASLIGRECERELWYNFHWARKPHFPGRIMRLFNRGHLEEARFVALLLTIGCQVWSVDQTGKQFRISDHGGHFGSALDSVVQGIPEIPNVPILAEFKTHGDKSFKKLAGKSWNDYIEDLKLPPAQRKGIKFDGEGVRNAKLEHYVQMQIYMKKMGLHHALYLAVNKNDDMLYAEIVLFAPEVADQYIDRAGRIIYLAEAPKKINQSPGFFKCKFCDMAPICHMDAAPAKNCRTCQYSAPRQDGSWFCSGYGIELTKENQLAGCQNWVARSAFK